VDGITIISRVNNNGDGLDFDGCTDVRVSNSSFDTSDDSICLHTSRQDKPFRDVVITNCTFCSKWAGRRIGLLSRGDFESVTVTNYTFKNIDDSGLKIQVTGNPHARFDEAEFGTDLLIPRQISILPVRGMVLLKCISLKFNCFH